MQVPMRRAARTRMRSTAGFSVIEVLIVVALIMVMVSMAVVQIQPAVQEARLNSAVQTALAQMRRARSLATMNRKVYRVSFILPQTVEIDRQDFDAGGNIIYTPILSDDLPSDVQFVAVSGIPTDPTAVPDGFGAGDNAVDFGSGSTNIYFLPDGRASNDFSAPADGVVYIARPNDVLSSRAISVFGATGRLKPWRIDGTPDDTSTLTWSLY